MFAYKERNKETKTNILNLAICSKIDEQKDEEGGIGLTLQKLSFSSLPPLDIRYVG